MGSLGAIGGHVFQGQYVTQEWIDHVKVTDYSFEFRVLTHIRRAARNPPNITTSSLRSFWVTSAPEDAGYRILANVRAQLQERDVESLLLDGKLDVLIATNAP
jgi:uncharacterized protein (DUF1778 family)